MNNEDPQSSVTQVGKLVLLVRLEIFAKASSKPDFKPEEKGIAINRKID